MTKKNKIVFTSIIIQCLFVTVIYRNDVVQFNIDKDLNPVVKQDNLLGFDVQVYTDMDTQEDTPKSTAQTVDYNKLYYYQRIAYAKSIDNEAEKSQPVKTQQQQQQNQTKQETQQPQQPHPIAQKRQVIDKTQYEYLITEAEKWIGIPYVWGGNSPQGTDCSGFVQQLYRSIGVELPRTSEIQSTKGLLVSRDALLPGDLLFFDTHNPRDYSDIVTPTQEMINAKQVEDGYKPSEASHVGLYVGDGMMIHAASGSGYIKYESIETTYYKTRFLNARRILIPQMKEE